MIARKIDRDTLERAAALIGVRAEIEERGRGFKIKLRPNVNATPPTVSFQRGRYVRYGMSRRADGSRRRIGAVCWHGFRDFFRACFIVAPFATFRTSVAFWQGRDDFEARYERTGEQNIGSAMDPLCFADACGCETNGGIECGELQEQRTPRGSRNAYAHAPRMESAELPQ
jgi:hypothetical protein